MTYTKVMTKIQGTNMSRERGSYKGPVGEGKEQKPDLSPNLVEILSKIAREAEIDAAIDAALEEGYAITRQEAIGMLTDRLGEEQGKI